ncbi:MAG: VC0807 family protein [Verrucomicrobiota bacterium]
MPSPAKRENLLANIVCNIALPFLILSKASGETRLGPVWALVVALAFPLGYFCYDFAQRRQANFVSILGFVSVLLTGGFALMELDGMWFAVKEASIPAVIGLAVLLSMNSKRPLIRQFVYNDQVIDTARVDAALEARGNREAFRGLMRKAGWLVTASFLVSAGLNFVLARWLLKSPAGSEAFNQELGTMNLLSWPVIVVPSMAMMMFALWQLFGGIKRLTGLELEQILHAPPEKK